MGDFLLSMVKKMSMKDEKPIPTTPVLKSFNLAGVVDYIQKEKPQNVIIMAGAGISCSAGIPDFRTKGTGLYSKLEKYGLPHPEAIFELDFFRNNPEPFYTLARELFPSGKYMPTPAHYFIKLLHEKGILLRCFTQNIDSLESLAGLPTHKLVAAHGNFDSATCIDTGEKVPIDEVEKAFLTTSTVGRLLRRITAASLSQTLYSSVSSCHLTSSGLSRKTFQNVICSSSWAPHLSFNPSHR